MPSIRPVMITKTCLWVKVPTAVDGGVGAVGAASLMQSPLRRAPQGGVDELVDDSRYPSTPQCARGIPCPGPSACWAVPVRDDELPKLALVGAACRVVLVGEQPKLRLLI